MAGILTQEERRAAEDAARVLSSPMFRGSVAGLEELAVKRWRGGKTPEEREDAWRDLKAAERLKGLLFAALENAAYKEEKTGVFRRMLDKCNILHKRGNHE